MFILRKKKKGRGLVIFLSFETVRAPRGVDAFIKATGYNDQAQLLKDIAAHHSSSISSSSPPRGKLKRPLFLFSFFLFFLYLSFFFQSLGEEV